MPKNRVASVLRGRVVATRKKFVRGRPAPQQGAELAGTVVVSSILARTHERAREGAPGSFFLSPPPPKKTALFLLRVRARVIDEVVVRFPSTARGWLYTEDGMWCAVGRV